MAHQQTGSALKVGTRIVRTRIPRVRNVRHLLSTAIMERGPLAELHSLKHSNPQRDGTVCAEFASRDWVLSILVAEFGGEARCVDVNSRLRRRHGLRCLEKDSLRIVRKGMQDLETLGKVSIEVLSSGSYVARLNARGFLPS